MSQLCGSEKLLLGGGKKAPAEREGITQVVTDSDVALLLAGIESEAHEAIGPDPPGVCTDHTLMVCSE